VIAVAVGLAHACALTSAGAVKCWGTNLDGELGNGGDPAGSSTPVDVAGLSSGVIAITAFAGGTCALTDVGTVFCWGTAGGPTPEDRGLSDVTAIDLGGDEFCAITSDGTSGCFGDLATAIASGGRHECEITPAGGVECMGDDSFGQLGNGTTSASPSPPVNVTGLSSGIVAIDAGQDHTCAITNYGGVKCWGDNTDGELGNGTTTSSSTPVDVTGP
jgi:alpha-tubulin suppressor-like RCC1 family protein